MTLYGLLSAQYLLWPVPLGLARPGRRGGGCTRRRRRAGLVGFYLFLAPGVLVAEALGAGRSRGPGGCGWPARPRPSSPPPPGSVAVLREGATGLRAATAATVTAVHLALAVAHDLERLDEPQDLAGLEEVLRA